MQTFSFVPINLHRCWSCEWKHSIEERSMTSRYHGRKIFWSQQQGAFKSKDDGDGNENGKKAIGLLWQYDNFASTSRFFVYFLTIVTRLRHETASANESAWRVEYVNEAQIFFTNGPFRFQPRKFANIWQIKWNWLRSVTFETPQYEFTL